MAGLTDDRTRDSRLAGSRRWTRHADSAIS